MGIPWSINVPPEVITEYVGTRLGQYFTDGDVMLKTQLAARHLFREVYDLDCIHIWSDPPCYVGVAALGGEVVFPDDDQPMVGNQGRVIEDIAQLDHLAVPSPYECELMGLYVGIYRDMRHELGGGARVGLGSGQAGPISTAVLLRGNAFFEDLHLQPAVAHKLLDLTTALSIAFRRAVIEIIGAEPASVGLADDFAGCIAPRMWPEFVVPYWRRIYEAFGPRRRTLHSEVLQRGHLRFMPELDIAVFDPGMDQYLTVTMIREEVDTPFTWNIFTSRDMLQGTPAGIQARYRQAVADGAPMMTMELCRRVPPENVRAYLEVARSLE